MHLPLDNLEVRYIGAPIALASNTDSNSSRIDMANYEAVSFIAGVVDSVATGVATLTIEQNDADSDTGMAAISGSAATATCAVNDDINSKVLASEVLKPMKRFVQAVRTSATANIAFGDVIALLVPKRRPAVQGSTVLDLNQVAP